MSRRPSMHGLLRAAAAAICRLKLPGRLEQLTPLLTPSSARSRRAPIARCSCFWLVIRCPAVTNAGQRAVVIAGPGARAAASALAIGAEEVQRSAAPQVGQVGVGDPPAQQPRAHMARLLRHSGEGGARVRRRVRLPPRARRRGRAQLPGLAVGRTSGSQEVYAAAVAHANRAPAGDGATAAAAAPEEAAAIMATDAMPLVERVGAAALAPLQVSTGDAGGFDWSRLLTYPIYSPVATGSHSYLLVVSPTTPTEAAADVEMEENASGGSGTGLWSFDYASTSSTHH